MSILALMHNRRRTIPSTPNPMDKSTIVSIYPKDIKEVKHTISPGYFHVPAGTEEKPAILVVGPSVWWREIDEQQPLLEIPNSSVQVANSIIADYCNGLIACNMSTAMPGLFFVPGEYTLNEILKSHRHRLEDAVRKQLGWYHALVRLADALWARSNGNPLVVDDNMKLAATKLGMQSKDWMSNHVAQEMAHCPACGALHNPIYPICGNCKAITDKDKAKALGITFAQ